MVLESIDGSLYRSLIQARRLGLPKLLHLIAWVELTTQFLKHCLGPFNVWAYNGGDLYFHITKYWKYQDWCNQQASLWLKLLPMGCQRK